MGGPGPVSLSATSANPFEVRYHPDPLPLFDESVRPTTMSFFPPKSTAPLVKTLAPPPLGAVPVDAVVPIVIVEPGPTP